MVTNKIVKATKMVVFNTYGCNLYRNRAQLSVSQVYVTVRKSFFCMNVFDLHV